MEQIEQRKVKRLQVAQKRLEYQMLAVEAEFEAKVSEQSISLSPTVSFPLLRFIYFTTLSR